MLRSHVSFGSSALLSYGLCLNYWWGVWLCGALCDTGCLSVARARMLIWAPRTTGKSGEDNREIGFGFGVGVGFGFDSDFSTYFVIVQQISFDEKCNIFGLVELLAPRNDELFYKWCVGLVWWPFSRQSRIS